MDYEEFLYANGVGTEAIEGVLCCIERLQKFYRPVYPPPYLFLYGWKTVFAPHAE